MEVDQVSGHVVDAALKIHKGIGPGLLESVYESLLAKELERRNLRVERQRSVDFEFDGLKFDRAFRVDMLVNECVIVELKSVETLSPVHAKRLLTYLRLMDLSVGLLINFGCSTLREGLQRIVNQYSAPPRDAFRSPRSLHSLRDTRSN